MTMRESNSTRELELVLNMSSMTALKSFIGRQTSGLSNLEFNYLRKNNPTLSRLNWAVAQRWVVELKEIADNLPLDELCRRACYIFITKSPILVQLSCNGRENLISNLSEDELQVFRNARLLDKNPSMEVVKWWDAIKLLAREDLNERLLSQGRQAEFMTYELECDTLRSIGINLKPEWVSIDSDYYGYDILSFRLDDNNSPINTLIEVKSFSKLSYPHFYLTKHEFKKARESHPHYYFYVWCFETKECKKLTFDHIVIHTPEDSGYGKWQNVLIELKHWDTLPSIE